MRPALLLLDSKSYRRLDGGNTMTASLHSLALLVGRILLAMIFFLSGVMKIPNWDATLQSMEFKGLPAAPVLLGLAILIEIGAGLAVLFGCQTRWAALLLAAFLIPVTITFHNFWALEGQEMQNQMQHFMKNLTILGGLLTLAAAGAGQYSWDAWLMRPKAYSPTIPAQGHTSMPM
jgi:putative oxidoreductase